MKAQLIEHDPETGLWLVWWPVSLERDRLVCACFSRDAAEDLLMYLRDFNGEIR